MKTLIHGLELSYFLVTNNTIYLHNTNLFNSPLTVDESVSFTARLDIDSFSVFCCSGEWRILRGISYNDFN